jgi:putative ABC transport system ATP-binding protein
MSADATPVFEARGLWRTYRQGRVAVTALAGVSLTVAQGEFLVLAGPSGSGKSTLLHLLGGLDRPDRGEVLVSGRNLAACTERERTATRRDQLGFVFQAFNLVPVLSAFENVDYGLWLQGVPRAERRERVDQALRAVGLQDRMHHRPDHLSGGERQRVALARALVHRPLAVIADEPTASLDSRTGGDIIDLLKTLNCTLGTTFVFATHDPAIIAMAPRVIRLADGHVVEPVGS